MGNQQRQIFASGFDFRKFDSKDIQTVIQVFAKLPFCDQFPKAAVGSRNDADIDFLSVTTAQGIKFFVFQNPQKFGLQ